MKTGLAKQFSQKGMIIFSKNNQMKNFEVTQKSGQEGLFSTGSKSVPVYGGVLIKYSGLYGALQTLVPYPRFSVQKNKKFERKLCVQFTTNQMRLSRFSLLSP